MKNTNKLNINLTTALALLGNIIENREITLRTFYSEDVIERAKAVLRESESQYWEIIRTIETEIKSQFPRARERDGGIDNLLRYIYTFEIRTQLPKKYKENMTIKYSPYYTQKPKCYKYKMLGNVYKLTCKKGNWKIIDVVREEVGFGKPKISFSEEYVEDIQEIAFDRFVYGK